jgi:hypothetical protein
LAGANATYILALRLNPGPDGISAFFIELALALRYLRPKRTFVSVITLLCILGVTLGVAVLIIVIAVIVKPF